MYHTDHTYGRMGMMFCFCNESKRWVARSCLQPAFHLAFYPPQKKKTGATVNGCKTHHVFGTKHHLKHQYESHSGSVNGGPNYYCLPCIAIAYWRRLPYESLRSRNPWGFINSSPGREVFGRL